MMKKGQQLLAIVGLLLATVSVLGVAYVRHYDWSEVILAGNVQEEPETQLEEEEIELDEIETTEMAEPEDEGYKFVKSDVSYFDDALFIGDSRAVGLKEYGTLDGMTYFTVQGMSIHNLWKKKIAVEDFGEITLEALLEQQSYGKVYIMLGYNELGYDHDYSAKRYKEAMDRIQEFEPGAIIYICSNLHVTEELSSKDELFNNEIINNYNKKLEELADYENFFYLDVNTLFDDENGNLPEDYAGDNVHPYAKHYKQWCEWFCENTIQK